MDFSEQALQIFLEHHPELLELHNLISENPPRWILIDREISISGHQGTSGKWYLDHLFVDQFGVLTLVEVKVSINNQIRREVIGQLLDYAANAKKAWPPNVIKQIFETYYSEKGENPIHVLLEFLCETRISAYDEFWKAVDQNTSEGHIRLVLLADEIPIECLNIIEFLDDGMQEREVWAVEIRNYLTTNQELMEEIKNIESKISKTKDNTPDFDSLYDFAENQAGYFSSSQASEAGYSYERLSENVKNGNFLRIRRGVYRLRYFPASRFEDLFVALLRTGPKSVISHESALAVYSLSDVIPNAVHVIMPRTGSRRRKGIQLHTNKIQADEITNREGLAITTPERTIADIIANGVSSQHSKQAVIEALRRGLTSKEKLLEQANRRKGRVEKFIKGVLLD